MFAEMILLLMGIINLLLLHLNGIDSINHITDLQAIVGLDFLLSDKTANLPFFTFSNCYRPRRPRGRAKENFGSRISCTALMPPSLTSA